MIDKPAADTIHGILTLALGRDWAGRLVGVPPGFTIQGVEHALGQLDSLRRHPDDWLTVTVRHVTLDLSGWVPFEVIESLVRIAVSVGVDRCAPAQLADEVEVMAELIAGVGALLTELDPSFDGLVTGASINTALASLRESSAASDGEKVVALRSAKHVCTVHNIVHATTVFTRVTDDTVGTSELGVMSLGERMTLPGGASIVRTVEGWELWQA